MLLLVRITTGLLVRRPGREPKIVLDKAPACSFTTAPIRQLVIAIPSCTRALLFGGMRGQAGRKGLTSPKKKGWTKLLAVCDAPAPVTRYQVKTLQGMFCAGHDR